MAKLTVGEQFPSAALISKENPRGMVDTAPARKLAGASQVNEARRRHRR